MKLGGRLVYATCSLLPEENEEQIDLFLKNHPDYTLLPISEIWSEIGGEIPTESPYLRLFPKDHNTDGFFAAVLQRNS